MQLLYITPEKRCLKLANQGGQIAFVLTYWIEDEVERFSLYSRRTERTEELRIDIDDEKTARWTNGSGEESLVLENKGGKILGLHTRVYDEQHVITMSLTVQ